MRPEFARNIHAIARQTMPLGPIQGWNTSVTPFFMITAAAREPELLTVLRQIGRHTGPLPLSSTGLAYRRCELARIDGEQIGARFLQSARKKATSSPSKRQHAESEHGWGFNTCGALGNKHGGKKYGRTPS